MLKNDLFPTISVFKPPSSASHNLMVWSQDELNISLFSVHTTDEIASLCPGKVIRGVLVQKKGLIRFFMCWMANTLLFSYPGNRRMAFISSSFPRCLFFETFIHFVFFQCCLVEIYALRQIKQTYFLIFHQDIKVFTGSPDFNHVIPSPGCKKWRICVYGNTLNRSFMSSSDVYAVHRFGDQIQLP